jgi:phenylalanine-4-hydroxylase
MEQHYDLYTEEDLKVWKKLYSRQYENLQGKSCSLYLECLDGLNPVLNQERIPDFNELKKALSLSTGWTIEVVPGLIPVDEFFQFLSERKFCSSTWLRSYSQLDYLEEPDMFHDIFGHIPMIAHEPYAKFMQDFGTLGVKHKDEPAVVKALQNIYWYTIEFGLMEGPHGLETYGAGIASSFGETNHVFNESVEIKDFSLEEIMNRDFVNSEIQNTYYRLESFEQLFNCLEALPNHVLSN